MVIDPNIQLELYVVYTWVMNTLVYENVRGAFNNFPDRAIFMI